MATLTSIFVLFVITTLITPLKPELLDGFTLPLIPRHDLTTHSTTLSSPPKSAANRYQSPLNRIHSLNTQSLAPNISSKLIFTGFDRHYVMKLYVGTPPTEVHVIADTGSDLTWIQCAPCKHCYKQNLRIFNSSTSFTFKKQSCNAKSYQHLPSSFRKPCNQSDQVCQYEYLYGDGSYGTIGTLSYEKFHWKGDNKTVDLGCLSFGCSDNTTEDVLPAITSGVTGLGRNVAVSFVSRLRYKRFAYCLAADEQDGSENSRIYFGSHALIFGAETPLVKGNDYSYYLTLQGISVGNKTVPLPPGIFDINEGGEGGFIVDSGTASSMLREALSNSTSLQHRIYKPYELMCFQGSFKDLEQVPKITLHFYGANLTLPTQNTYVKADGEIWCLTIVKSFDPVSILGTAQTLNYYVGYDLEAGVVSFAPVNCATFNKG